MPVYGDAHKTQVAERCCNIRNRSEGALVASLEQRYRETETAIAKTAEEYNQPSKTFEQADMPETLKRFHQSSRGP